MTRKQPYICSKPIYVLVSSTLAQMKAKDALSENIRDNIAVI